MKKIDWLFGILLGIGFTLPGRSMAQEFIPLWPEGSMPNSKGMQLERIEERERVTQMDVPGMYSFFTSKDENAESAVLIFPGGGYHHLTYNSSGIQLAKWLYTLGVNAFVVMYRLPSSPDLVQPHLGPLQDAQRAIKIVRGKAGKWGIHPEKIGVMGCSAGGHLAANLCTIGDDYANIGDAFDTLSFRPAFQILISPVISMMEHVHTGSRAALLGDQPGEEQILYFSNEFNASPNSPIAFLVHADNDTGVSPLNSVRYYLALKEAGVEASLHIFPHGKHSIALRNNPGSTNLWTHICEAWLREYGFLKQTGTLKN